MTGVLLVKRAEPPFRDAWCLPGGHCKPGEILDAAAKRKLYEETGLEVPLVQLYASLDGNDPRGWGVSVFYGGFVGDPVRFKLDMTICDVALTRVDDLPENIVPWYPAVVASCRKEMRNKWRELSSSR